MDISFLIATIGLTVMIAQLLVNCAYILSPDQGMGKSLRVIYGNRKRITNVTVVAIIAAIGMLCNAAGYYPADMILGLVAVFEIVGWMQCQPEDPEEADRDPF